MDRTILASVNIPSLNGNYEGGIIVGVDPSLRDNVKMPVLHVSTDLSEDAKLNALFWATDLPNDYQFKFFYGGIVVALFEAKMLRWNYDSDKKGGKHATTPDGDWYMTKSDIAVTQAKADLINTMLSDESIKHGLTYILATKANYWLMNHHTGMSNKLTGYVEKTFRAFNGRDASEEEVTTNNDPEPNMSMYCLTAIHALGHYCSTRVVLKEAGVKHVVQTLNLEGENDYLFTLSADAKLRFTGLPAGTHKLGAASGCLRRLAKHFLVFYTPDVQEFNPIPPLIDAQVTANPAKYHIGAAYITGRPRLPYNEMDNYLGRLGTFLLATASSSTLAKSPHLALAKVQSYEDYSDEYYKFVIGFKKQAIDFSRIAVSYSSSTTEEDIQTLRHNVFGL